METPEEIEEIKKLNGGVVPIWTHAVQYFPEEETRKTLRDEIAIAALTVMLAYSHCANRATARAMARLSYQIADWMLEARESSSTESQTRT